MSQKPVTVRFLPNRYVPEVYPLSSPMDETFCAVMGPVCISVVAGRRERGTEGGRGCEIERESVKERDVVSCIPAPLRMPPTRFRRVMLRAKLFWYIPAYLIKMLI